MRIVIAGASGLVGQAFFEEYSGVHDIVALGRADTDYSIDSLLGFLTGADALINLAGVRFPPATGPDSLAHYSGNVDIMENLLSACIRAKISNFVFASSISVYSARDQQPWREDRLCHPKNFYGDSKLKCEQLGTAYSEEHGMKVKSLRIASVFSDREREGYLLRTIFDNAKAGRPQTIYGSGKGVRSYIYIRDLVRALLMAVESPALSGIYNIGPAASISIEDIVINTDREFGNAAPIVYLNDRPEDLSVSVMDVSGAQKSLGFEAVFSIEEAIRDIHLRWLNGDGR